jgi:beta-N-acetylhexosaminidase
MFDGSKTYSQKMSLGCMMIGIEGLVLTERDRQRLMHPAVAGVVLFSRNFQSAEQLLQLTTQIHCLRHPRLLVAVDHEGGRVQRFKQQGFTHWPAMSQLGALYDDRPTLALSVAQDLGWLLASELLACGVDFSFTPVCDLDYGQSHVIGDRALHHNPHVVAQLAQALVNGMQSAGMAAVAKHFPGHGYVLADTHTDIALDERDYRQLHSADMQPFAHLVQHHVAAVMVAHVIYPQVDDQPAGMSAYWLQQILRGQWQYQGAIISDDLGMKAVADLASTVELVHQFVRAGCDLVLLCNDWQQIDDALSGWREYDADPIQESRLIRLHGKPKQHQGLYRLQLSVAWLQRMKALAQVGLVHWQHMPHREVDG